MKFSNLVCSLSIFILIVIVSTAQSQFLPYYVFTGEAAGDRFGESVSGAGDVNNDGYDDVIVGARTNDAGGSNAGRAYVYSGRPCGAMIHVPTDQHTIEAAIDTLMIGAKCETYVTFNNHKRYT